MSKRRTPRGLEPILAQLRGQMKPGVLSVEVAHDDWCAIWRTGHAGDCDCEPNLVLPPTSGPNRRERRAARKGGQS